MAIRQYTREQLLHLRASPLISKPDNLPAIEQWLEYVYVDKDSREKLRIPHSEAQTQQSQSNVGQKQQQQRRTPGEASPMGNFGQGSSRPNLLATRSHGGSRTGDDVSLGPPKTVFASSRNVQKFGDAGEKNGDGEEHDGPRSRFFGDKSNRKSVNEKESGHTRDSWTRKGFGGDEEKPESRWGRREKDADGEKRNGYGDRHDTRWGERRQNGERQGGWRDRERERREPEWNRDSRPEKEPEWMDDPAPPGAEDDLRTMGMPRNQEQFQKWKEAMSGKKTSAEAPPPEPEMKETTAAKPSAVPLKLDGFTDKTFGGWGESKPAVTTPDAAPAPAKTGTAKGKGSRFASMFKESQAKEEPPPQPPPETNVQAAANKVAHGAAEDEAGFKRILQMLGNTNVSQPAAAPDGPSSPQPKGANGSVKQKSRFTGFFDQAGPKSPERVQSPPEQVAPRHLEEIFSSSRGMPQEGAGMFGMPEQRRNEQGRDQMPTMVSPEPPPGLNGGNQRPQSGRMNDIFLEQPPSRGADTPDVNIQNLLAAQRAQRPQAHDKNSEFLLNLLQTKGSSRPPSQQARPDNFSLWLDQPPPNNMPEPHAPKPRVPPPPGLFEDQLLRNAPPDAQRQEMHGHDIPQRRQSQRTAAPGMPPPPGFFDEQSMYMQQPPRRNFPEPPPQPQQQQPGRRMSGHPNLPQMQIPPGMPPQQFGGPPPPPQQQPNPQEFIQSPTNGPPPGFNPHMARHPPGLGNIPNIFQAPQQGGRGEPPPGFGGGGMQSPPGVPPPVFYGGGNAGGGPPPGVPPGFMGMRGPGEGMAVGAGGGGRGRGFEGGFEGRR